MQIKTKTGTVIGKTDHNNMSEFLGIPYALPPVGELRFKAPVPIPESDQQILAYNFGHTAVQEIDEIESASISSQGQSEDCLTLNIWNHNMASGIQKPVMVFIHGGSYSSGGSSDPLYNGYNFALNQDVVFVTLNYRVNFFGFMNFEEYGGSEYKTSGYNGLLDQICALQWIKENISAFGGDNENITILGESAGGGSVSLLMTMPKAKGLFHKVIAQSGSLNLCKGSFLSKQHAADFASRLGCETIDELLKVPTEEIRKIYPAWAENYGPKYSILLAQEADNEDIPRDPFKELAGGCASNIKLMLGTNANEFNYWKLYFDNFDDMAIKFLEDQLYITTPPLINEIAVREEFFRYRQNHNMKENNIALNDEILFRLPAIHMAEKQSRYNDVYMYYFTWKSRIKGLGACHALELPFVFGNMEEEESFTGLDVPDNLSSMMQEAWASFAKAGKPSAKGAPQWAAYNDADRNTMIIDSQWTMEKDPEGASRCIIDKMFSDNR